MLLGSRLQASQKITESAKFYPNVWAPQRLGPFPIVSIGQTSRELEQYALRTVTLEEDNDWCRGADNWQLRLCVIWRDCCQFSSITEGEWIFLNNSIHLHRCKRKQSCVSSIPKRASFARCWFHPGWNAEYYRVRASQLHPYPEYCSGLVYTPKWSL